MQKLSRLGSAADGDAEKDLSSAHIRVGRLKSARERARTASPATWPPSGSCTRNAVAAAEDAWESAETEGMPDVPAALQTVEGLADAVTQNRTALVALTAMRNYDNYTFTHMVNVSILTMGQARALGIDGRLLREFGLSALMHDIGKVRTPKEILNKPDKLTDEEFVDHAAARRRRRRDPAADAGDADPRAGRRLRASPADRRHRLSLWRQARDAQPGDDAVQHRRRLRRDALAARVPAGATRPTASSRC